MTPTVVTAPGTLTTQRTPFGAILRIWQAQCPQCGQAVEVISGRSLPSVLCKCGTRVLIETKGEQK